MLDQLKLLKRAHSDRVRYFCDELLYNFDRNNYVPNSKGGILGDAKWKWLDAILQNLLPQFTLSLMRFN